MNYKRYKIFILFSEYFIPILIILSIITNNIIIIINNNNIPSSTAEPTNFFYFFCSLKISSAYFVNGGNLSL